MYLRCNCRSTWHVCALYPNRSFNIASCYICIANLYCLLKCGAMQACFIGAGSGMHLQKQGWDVLAAWCCKCCGKSDSSVSSLQGSCATVDLAWLVPHSQCCRLGLCSLLQGQSAYAVQWYHVSTSLLQLIHTPTCYLIKYLMLQATFSSCRDNLDNYQGHSDA